MKNGALVLVLLALAATAGCREEDGVFGGSDGRLFVSSDPEGARIFIDAASTNLLTPDTIDSIGGRRSVLLTMDSGGFSYAVNAQVTVRGGQLTTLRAPLGCTGTLCINGNSRQHTYGNMSFRINAAGPLFLTTDLGRGMLWPAGTDNGYINTGMPMFAAKVGGRAVALGMYNNPYMVGRPAPVVTETASQLRIDQKSWISPRTDSLEHTVRGIEVRQQILVDASLPDVMLIRLTYRNITTSPLYQVIDQPGSDTTYEDVYLGFGLDPDIGQSDDDWSTYDPALDAVIAYDANFSDAQLQGSQNTPGMIGLRMLSAPFGARVVLNAYHRDSPQTPGLGDWVAGTSTEGRGWGVLSGTAAYQPDDPDQDIGMLVPGPSDVRIIVSAGPYVLRPSEEISVIVAVAIARPTAGTFTSPAVVSPGSPTDAGRQIMLISADLRAKLEAAATLLPAMTN